ncbi:MAG TPA: hypothetical protein VFP72_01875 [Kineosporiaceae bacterium]|nr:hypothetical protein [Kineosporiaceae bacterium]
MRAWLVRAFGGRPKIQWVVAVLGLVLTAATLVSVMRMSGSYETNAYVVMLAPEDTGANAFIRGANLIDMAAIINRDLNGMHPPARPTTEDIPLSATGTYHGYSVRMTNSGNQWLSLFYKPELFVQVTGSSPEEVTIRLDALVRRIEDDLYARQAAFGTSPSLMIRTDLSPPNPAVSYVHGSKGRAGAAVALLGLALTLTGMKLSRRLRTSHPRLLPLVVFLLTPIGGPVWEPDPPDRQGPPDQLRPVARHPVPHDA